MRGEEKRQARRDVVHGQPARPRRFHVSDSIGERESHFLDGRRARLADVVAADGDEIPLGGRLATKTEKARLHGLRTERRIDVGPPRVVFLLDVYWPRPD